MMKWLFFTFIYVAIFVILSAALLAGYWTLWPFKTFEPSSSVKVILNDNHTVEQDEYVVYMGGGIHYTSGVQVDVYAELVDGFVLQYAKAGYVTEAGVYPAKPTAKYKVPCFIPPGTYKLKIVSVFHINPLRNITLVVVTEPFEVVANPRCTQQE